MAKELNINNVRISKDTLSKVIPGLDKSQTFEIKNFVKLRIDKSLQSKELTLKELKAVDYITVDTLGYVLAHKAKPTYRTEGIWISDDQYILRQIILLPENPSECIFNIEDILTNEGVA